MRHETDNAKSLNDVMRFMNRWFAERDAGFEEGDVERACTAISNHDFAEFFARHVQGTMDPPFAEYLAYAGIEYDAEVITCSFPFVLRGNRIAGRPSLDDDDTPGPRPGERLLAIDGEEFTTETDFLRAHAPGDRVLLLLERQGREREVEIALGNQATAIPRLRFAENPSEREMRIREAWLSSVR